MPILRICHGAEHGLVPPRYPREPSPEGPCLEDLSRKSRLPRIQPECKHPVLSHISVSARDYATMP